MKKAIRVEEKNYIETAAVATAPLVVYDKNRIKRCSVYARGERKYHRGRTPSTARFECVPRIYYITYSIV